MNRRELILLMGATATWPLAGWAQQSPLPIIGSMNTASPAQSQHLMLALREGLRQGGFVEGQTVSIEYRWAEGRYEVLPEIADDLAKRQVALIVAGGGTVSARAAKATARTIPIVFVTGDDPARVGLVESLNRPGGNITGVSLSSAALDVKRLELVRELIGRAAPIAFLVNRDNPNAGAQRADFEAAASAVGQAIHVHGVTSPQGIDLAFQALVEQQAGALVVANDPFFVNQRAQIVELAARHSVPTIYPYREYAAAGGLIAYGTSIAEAYRQAGVYAGRILKGERPADLPIQLPTTFELVINLRAAREIALTLSPAFLARADEVIE